MKTQNVKCKTQSTLTKGTGAGRGFTLMEVMVVVGIIVILAAITVAVGVGVRRKGSEAATKATLKSLDNAMAEFLKNHPDPAPTKNWVMVLQVDPASASTMRSVKVSMVGGNPAVLDGYGDPIVYIPSGGLGGFCWTKPNPSSTWTAPNPFGPATWKAKPAGYFWSWGPDGMAGVSAGTNYSADDIFSDGTAAQ
jgi:prepilin-type N-terminal cleavage/methylation domain-containing protein